MLITTNETFQDKKINKYLGQVNEQIVVGANIFKDVFASFRDVFGGETKGYKKELDKLKKASLKGLSDQAKQLNANGVIGFRMDIDEISGGGKSMFMLNVFGTAVEFENSSGSEEDVASNEEMSSEEVQHEIERLKIKEKLGQGAKPLHNIKVDELINFEIFGVLDEVVNIYDPVYQDENKVLDYLIRVPINEFEELLKFNIESLDKNGFEVVCKALEGKNWYNYNLIMELLRDDIPVIRFRGLILSTIDKKYYNKSDITSISNLINFLKTDLNRDPEIIFEKGTFSSTEFWLCPRCLRKNDVDNRLTCTCGSNKFGLINYDLEEFIEKLSMRLKVLKSNLNQ